MDIGAAFIAYPQPPVLMQPTDSTFDDPPGSAQAAAMAGVPLGNHRLDACFNQYPAMGQRIVRTVSQQVIEAVTRRTDTTGDRWHVIHQRQQLRHIVPVGTGQADCDGHQ